MKMTFQPKTRQRSKVHGFKIKNEYSRWKKSFSSKKSKGKKETFSLIDFTADEYVSIHLLFSLLLYLL